MLAGLALSALAAPLSLSEVPIEAGLLPTFPMTEEAFRLGPAACVARVAVAPEGAVQSADVSGCDPTFAEPLKAGLAKITLPAGFAKDHPSFEVEVRYEPPPMGRKRDPESRLEDAIHVDTAPERYYDKKPFLPHGEKGGSCVLEVFVEPDGEPFAVDLRECPQRLRLAAEMASLEWRYRPVLVDGAPVAARFGERVNIR